MLTVLFCIATVAGCSNGSESSNEPETPTDIEQGQTQGADGTQTEVVRVPGYHVIYDANGADSGTVPVDTNGYKTGDMATILDNTGNLQKEGYIFDGWVIYDEYTETFIFNDIVIGGNPTYINPGDEIFVGRDIKLLAYWAKRKVAITIPNGMVFDGLRSLRLYWQSASENAPTGEYTITVSGLANTMADVPIFTELTPYENAQFIVDLSDVTIKSKASFSVGQCEPLKEVKLPISLTAVSAGAFKDCTNLERVVFGSLTGWFFQPEDSTEWQQLDVANPEENAIYLKNGGGCEKRIPVTSILLSQTSISLFVGETETITVIVLPEDATDKTVVWESSDTSVATVYEGKIYARAVGDAIISATIGDVVNSVLVSVVKIPVTDMQLSETSLIIDIGNSKSIEITFIPENATDTSIQWKSEDTSIAVVENGVITGVGVGETIITATSNGITKDITVRVKEKVVSIESISLSAETLYMDREQSVRLVATVLPENATNKTIAWESSDTSVATVDNGIVMGVGYGKATITATAGAESATAVVIIRVPVEKVELSSDFLAMNVGSSETLIATVYPLNATDAEITWESSNESVATVDNGIITGVGYGKATITATAGAKSATVIVVIRVPVEKIELSSDFLAMNVGSSETLIATVYPLNATDAEIIWESSNESVATVDNGTITALSGGTTTITATCGDFSNSCLITVYVPVSDITLSETSISVIKDCLYKIRASVLPADATDKAVTWSSDDTTVAKVERGLIEAVGVGNAVITVSAGNVTKTIRVTVTAGSGTVAVSGLLLSATQAVLQVGDTKTIIATVNPINADDANVSWVSADESIATVKYGTITAISQGSTTITATVGTVSKTIQVTVVPASIPVSAITISPNVYSLAAGKTKTLIATLLPAMATERNVTWSSSDDSVATVSSSGVVTGKKSGIVTITATADSGVAADAAFVVSETGLVVSIPKDAVYSNDDFIALDYERNGTVYTFKATSPVECAYIAFYVNGEQKLIWGNVTNAEYALDVATLEEKYVSVYAFGFYSKDNNGAYNDFISSKNQISIEVPKE